MIVWGAVMPGIAVTARPALMGSVALEKQGQASGVNLSIEERDLVSMIGPNGGGKTTLLKIMLGLLAPDSGEAVEQVLDTPRMEVLRERGVAPIVTEGSHHRRCLQRGRQRLEDTVARERIDRHRRIADADPVVAGHRFVEHRRAGARVRFADRLRVADEGRRRLDRVKP